jgi:hypothetical protein
MGKNLTCGQKISHHSSTFPGKVPCKDQHGETYTFFIFKIENENIKIKNSLADD